MSTNNELSNMPGFFFCPADAAGLIKLSEEERATLMCRQGNYMVTGFTGLSEGDRCDLLCALDNARIPTHRHPEATIPKYGDVPFDLIVKR
jgi:hypothetical protein